MYFSMIVTLLLLLIVIITRYTKQYAFGFQVFELGISDIYYRLDFLFFSHWWRHCGGIGIAKTGEEIPLREAYEQGEPRTEGKDSRLGKRDVAES